MKTLLIYPHDSASIVKRDWWPPEIRCGDWDAVLGFIRSGNDLSLLQADNRHMHRYPWVHGSFAEQRELELKTGDPRA